MIEQIYHLNSLFFYRLIFMAWLIFGEALFLFKFERKKHFLIKLPLVLLSCFVFALIFPIPTSNSFYSMMMFFLMFLFTYFASFFLFEANWKIRLFSMICGYTCEHIAYETYFSVINLLNINKNGLSGLYDYGKISLFTGWQDILIYFFSYIIVYYLIFIMFALRLNKNNFYEAKYDFKFLVVGCVFILSDIVINSIVSWYSTIHFENIYLGIVALINVLCCFIGLFYIFEMFYSNNIKNQMKIIEEIQKKESSQYKISKETIDMINIKCHDFRHQIREFGDNQKIDVEAITNLNKLIRIYDSTYHTENEALNVILNEKTLLCNNKNIRFTCIVDGNALNFIENEDIYSLFGNLIDNAMEAVYKIQDVDKRHINLVVKNVNSFVSISIDNYYEGNIVLLDNGLPKTTKEDKDYHGYGMKSIQLIVNKYDGDLNISLDNNVFSLFIMFPIK